MNYEQRLRAVGRLIDAAALRGVCVMEHDHGVLVVGIGPVTIADERVVQPASLDLDTSLIERTLQQLDYQPGSDDADNTGDSRSIDPR